MSRYSPPAHRGLKTLLAVGFLLLAWAILAAWADPANGYEVSIYWSTTLGFWIGAGMALLASVVAMVYAGRGAVGALGLFLGGMTATAIVGLPVIRNYRFHGLADPMTHLAWSQALRAGEMSAFELIYPGGHLAAVQLGEFGGISTPRAMMLVVLAALVAYIVFVPLTLRVLIPDRIAVIIAAISAFLFLPLNTIGTHRMFHPYSLGTLLFPFLLYVLFKHITGDAEDGTLPSVTSAAGLLLPIIAAGLLFLNSQVTLNILIFFGTIAAVQFAFRRWRPDHRISRYRSIYGQTVFLAVVFFAWNLQFWQTYSMLDGLIAAVVNTILGTVMPGEIVQQRGESASQLGVSMTELFAKLFLVSAVYVGLSVALVGGKIGQMLREDHPDNHAAITYFTFSGFTLGPFFLAHFLGDISSYFFRHLGFAMVVITILGASALFALYRSFPEQSRVMLRPAAVIVVVVMLVLSLAVVYQSPYIYKRNHHVSDQLMSGYGGTFENAPDAPEDSEEAVWYISIRSGPGRFTEVYGVDEVAWKGSVDSAVLGTNLTSHYAKQTGPDADRDYYLPVSRMSKRSEVYAYRGFRYPRESFEGIHSQRGVHRVQANGGYTLYYVDTSFASNADK